MQKVYDVLYKKTKTGATQTWWMEQDDSRYRTFSGHKDSENIIVTEWTECFPKNVGKKNETTAVQQASLEIESQYKKKLSQGNYNLSIDDIHEDNFFQPMLANKYEKGTLQDKDFQEFEIYSQPKLDGMRCIATREGLFSRQGKRIVSVPHIEKALQIIWEKYPDSNLILDGELYSHSLKNNFNKIISLTRKTKPDENDLKESEQYIQYHVYDLVSKAGFDSRHTLLKVYFWDCYNRSMPDCLKLVRTDKLENLEHLYEKYSEYVMSGYEGQMIRIGNYPYESKRVKHLLKHKEFLDEEFEIVSIEEGEGNRSRMAGHIVYKMKDGKTFKSNIRGGVSYYIDLLCLKNKYIGGTGTVRFFEYTPDGIPRFPVTISAIEGKRDY